MGRSGLPAYILFSNESVPFWRSRLSVYEPCCLNNAQIKLIWFDHATKAKCQHERAGDCWYFNTCLCSCMWRLIQSMRNIAFVRSHGALEAFHISDSWYTLVCSCLERRGASAIWFVNHWWHLTSSTLISVSPCCAPRPWSTSTWCSSSDGGYLRRQKANGQLEKTTGSPSKRLAQQCSGECQRYPAVYAVEIWARQGSRSGATVHSDYVTMTAMSRRNCITVQIRFLPNNNFIRISRQDSSTADYRWLG